MKTPVIPVILEAAALLAALTRPNHIVHLCSWGRACLPPSCSSNAIGYIPVILKNAIGITLTLLVFCADTMAQVALPGDIIRPVNRQLERLPDRLSPLRQAAENTQSELDNLGDKIVSLPDTLTITDPSGQVLLEEVRDENGDLAVSRQWLVLAEATDTGAIESAGFEIMDTTVLTSLGGVVFRLKVTASVDELAAIRAALPQHLRMQLGRNHIYLSQSALPGTAKGQQALLPPCDAPLKVAMLDTGIDTTHPVFKQLEVRQRYFTHDKISHNSAHGTAVAGILGQMLSANSEIISAAIFYQRSLVSQGATLMSLLSGLNWLAEQQPAVINLSLTGPANPLLNRAIASLSLQGIGLVAAAGNGGPAAKPAYPAAYSNVVAVSAVDSNKHVYRWANQGQYVDFAAFGVAVTTARQHGAWGNESGTSMAAPLVTARAACLLQSINIDSLETELAKFAEDLGEPGKDPVFGWGLIR